MTVKKSIWKMRRTREAFSAYLFIFPFFLLMILFTFTVFIMGAAASLTDAQGIESGEFIGLANYAKIFDFSTRQNRDFLLSLKNTFLFAAGCLATQIPCAFILAYILNNIPKGMRGALRAVFFIPVLINNVVIALLFRMLFNRDQGIINWLLGLVGLPNNTDWTRDSGLCIPLLVIVSFWQWTGFHMVYFLAYLQTVDRSLYEAARLDGASHGRILARIVLPHMRPAFTFVMITSAIGALQLFDLVFLVFPDTSYGPGGAAKTLIAYIYDEAFAQNNQNIGYASAVGWVVFLVIFAVSLVQLRLIGLGRSADE